MPRAQKIRRAYQPPAGLNLRAMPELRPMTAASSMKNADFFQTLDGDVISQRKGFKYLAHFFDSGVHGPDGQALKAPIGFVNYVRTDPDTGLDVVEHIAIGSTLYPLRERTVTINYTGSDPDVLLNVITEGGTIRFQITEGGTTVINRNIETGLGVGDTYASLKIAVDALTDFSMTVGTGHEAYVNGNQIGVTTITVDDGAGGNHNLEVGEIVRIPTPTGNQYRKITKVTGTTISFDGSAFNVDDNDNIVLNLLSQRCGTMEQVVNGDLSGGSYTITVLEPDPLYFNRDRGNSDIVPFTNTLSGHNNEEFRIPSVANANNCLYIAAPMEDKKSAFLKYDGQNLYKPGCWQPFYQGSTGNGAGNIDVGRHTWVCTYVQIDHQGNEIESLASDPWSVNVATASYYDFQISSIFHVDSDGQQGEGYLQNSFDVATNAVGVNTVDAQTSTLGDRTPSVHVGDKIFFYDRNTGAHVTRNVTEVTYVPSGVGTVTFDGAAVDLNAGDPVSCNAKLRLYRTKVGGSLFYEVGEFVPDINDNVLGPTFSPSTVIRDDVADLNLGARYFVPEVNEEHGLLGQKFTGDINTPSRDEERPKYLTVYQGSLVVIGTIEQPNTIFYSSPGQPEYFSRNAKADIGKNASRVLTGGGVSGDFLILFKDDETHRLSGKLLDPNTILPSWRVDQIDASVGCPSHDAIVETEKTLFFPSRQSIHAIINGGNPVDIGTTIEDNPRSPNFGQVISSISPIIRRKESDEDKQLRLEHAQAVYDPINRKYILFIPAQKRSSGLLDPVIVDSTVLAYDIERRSWRQWTNLNMASGVFEYAGDIWFLARDTAGATTSSAARFHNTGTVYDFADHEDAIDWELVTGWDTADSPTGLAKFLRTALRSTIEDETPDFSLTVETHINYIDAAHSSFTAAFSAAARVITTRLLSTKAESLRYKFTNSQLYKRVMLTSWEHEISVPHDDRLRSHQ